uniref:interleukin-1 beta-like n=1 Tax=Pristiophorus japonicus TaxID=55135 RepID=UPI00398F14C6
MKTEVGPVTIPMVDSESRRTFSHRRRRNSRLTSPVSCPQLKSLFQETLPKVMETSTANHRADGESYQLEITGTSSSITTAGNAVLSLEKAVMLVLAVEKFKKGLGRPSSNGWGHKGTSFKGSELLGSFNALVEEAITCISYDDTEQANSSYRFMRSERTQVKDEQDKSLMLSDNLQLVALFLQEPKDEVTLDVRYYKTAVSTENDLPVVLGINRRNLFLSCTGSHDRPRMQVEKWDKTLQNISSATDLLRFVFYKKDSSSGEDFEFESAMYRGWYISTSRKSKQPVDMDRKEHRKRITIFTAE